MRPPIRKFLLALPAFALFACEEATPDEGTPDGTGGAASGGSAGTAAGSATGGASSGTGGAGPGGSSPGTGGAAGSAGAAPGGAASGGSNGAGAGAGGVAGNTGGAAGDAGGAAGGSGGMAGGNAGNGGGGMGNAGAGGSGGMGNAGAGGSGPMRPARVLLYSFSTLDIPSVPAQLTILENKLEGFGYEVDRSVDPAVFTDTNLARYAAVGMINTCFFPFGANNTTGEPQSSALQRFLQQGGGLFGTHCADVTFQSASTPVLYNRLLGGRASSENFTGNSECRGMGTHPTIAELPATFTYSGNLDNTNYIAPDTTVLVKCRWGNAAQTDVAVSWVRNEGAGRVFFTNFAKVDADLTNATIGDDHIISGLAWVLGRPLPL